MDKLLVCVLLVLAAVAFSSARSHGDRKHHNGHHNNKHHGHHNKMDHSHHKEHKHKKNRSRQNLHNEACVKKAYLGCNIEKGHCVCTQKAVVACKNPFHYKNRHQCHKDQKGTLDKCRKRPCLNNGVCVQVKGNKWACSCAGTNYYGETCAIKCPAQKFLGKDRNYPAACIF